jgi:outer membrane protein
MEKRSFEARRSAAAVLAALVAVGGVPGAAAQVAPPAAAARITVPTLVTEVPAAPELVVEDGRILLQLEDAIVLALRRNLGLSVERYGHQQTLLGIVQSEGIYDLRLQSVTNLSDSESPSLSFVEGVPVVQSDRRSSSFSLAQLTPWGGEARTRLFASRTASNSADLPFNPAYSASGGVELAQPLLRDFGRLVTERPIIQARLASGQSREIFEQQVANLLLDVENAYWDLVEEGEQLNVARQSLELARELHERNRIQVDVGTLAPIEMVQSEATIALREEGIITAGARLGDAADRLLQLLNLKQAMAEGLTVEPRTPPQTPPVEIDLERGIATALAERPEIRQQQLQVERFEVDAAFFRNQKLPVADVVVGYESNAQAGRARPDLGFPITALNEDLPDAFGDVFQREFPGWSIGLTVAMPLQNRSARAASAIADLDLEQGRTVLGQLELEVITQVRSAARAVRTAEQQITSAQATVRLQERNLDAEQRRYENGMSTSFRITEIQEDLTAARSRLVSAITNYRRALTSYHRATGRLLDESGVELAGPVDVELPRRTIGSVLR